MLVGKDRKRDVSGNSDGKGYLESSTQSSAHSFRVLLYINMIKVGENHGGGDPFSSSNRAIEYTINAKS